MRFSALNANMIVIIDHIPVRYTDEGTGPVLVLLHGWGAGLDTFNALAQELQSNFRVVRLDFPGFGQTPKPAQDWGVGEYANFLQMFLTKLNLGQPFVLIGHSFGGRVILKSVGSGLVQTQKIILLASAGIQKSQNVRNKSFALVAKVGKVVTSLPGLSTLQGALRKKLYQAAGSEDYLNAGNMKPIFLKVIHEDLQTDAARIRTPSLLIWGEQDDTTPVEDGKQLHAQIKNSELKIIPQAGHFVYVDAAPQVTQMVKEFLV